MDIQTLLNSTPYALSQHEKEAIFIPMLNDLIQHHTKRCPEYARIINTLYQGRTIYHSLEEMPCLPVNIFKEMYLASIPKNEIFKTLLSSGTTGAIPSQIILDSATAHRQTMALAVIMESFLGTKRLPMLIIDTPAVVSDSKRFSARGAGVVGMAHFGRDHFYALDDQLQLDHMALKRWLKQHEGTPLFIFGFTYLIWQHFFKATKPKEFDLSQATLFHSGGWKKLNEASVDNQTFKTVLDKHFNLKRCHNFYGMVEQAGNIFVECEEGYLHCPTFADIIIRNPLSWKPAGIGQPGLAQVLSLLPTSYPGHSLIAEDLGTIEGIDSCLCGRKGKFFWIQGRVPQAEPRGCGDTFALHKAGG